MMHETGKSATHVTRAVEALRHMIFSGDLPPGSNHLEGELAETLGISRTPVHEAVLILEAQGLLDVRPRKGVRILPISPDDMAEIYDILTELECMCARHAAEARHDKTALAPLARAIDAMDTALDADDLLAWAAADEQFHDALVRLGGNGRAAAITAMMSDQVRRARLSTLFMRAKPVQSNEDHRRVYDAIAHGAAQPADQIHRAHRLFSKIQMIDLLNKHRLRFV